MVFIWLQGKVFRQNRIKEVREMSNCWQRWRVDVVGSVTAAMFLVERTERVRTRIGLSTNIPVTQSRFTKWSTNWVFGRFLLTFLFQISHRLSTRLTILEISVFSNLFQVNSVPFPKCQSFYWISITSRIKWIIKVLSRSHQNGIVYSLFAWWNSYLNTLIISPKVPFSN